MTPASSLSLTDLARDADVTPRTVRYYIGQGLLPGPIGQGPSAHYDDSHLDRLRLIKRLQRQHLPLAEIRSRLEELDDEQIASLVDEGMPATSLEPEIKPGSALSYIQGVLGGLPARPEVMAALASPRAPPLPKPRSPGSDRSTWERISLAPDIELHVRRPLDRQTIKQLDQLLDAARKLLREE